MRGQKFNSSTFSRKKGLDRSASMSFLLIAVKVETKGSGDFYNMHPRGKCVILVKAIPNMNTHYIIMVFAKRNNLSKISRVVLIDGRAF